MPRPAADEHMDTGHPRPATGEEVKAATPPPRLRTQRSHPAAVMEVEAAASRRGQGGAEAAPMPRIRRRRPRPVAEEDGGETKRRWRRP